MKSCRAKCDSRRPSKTAAEGTGCRTFRSSRTSCSCWSRSRSSGFRRNHRSPRCTTQACMILPRTPVLRSVASTHCRTSRSWLGRSEGRSTSSSRQHHRSCWASRSPNRTRPRRSVDSMDTRCHSVRSERRCSLCCSRSRSRRCRRSCQSLASKSGCTRQRCTQALRLPRHTDGRRPRSALGCSLDQRTHPHIGRAARGKRQHTRRPCTRDPERMRCRTFRSGSRSFENRRNLRCRTRSCPSHTSPSLRSSWVRPAPPEHRRRCRSERQADRCFPTPPWRLHLRRRSSRPSLSASALCKRWRAWPVRAKQNRVRSRAKLSVDPPDPAANCSSALEGIGVQAQGIMQPFAA